MTTTFVSRQKTLKKWWYNLEPGKWLTLSTPTANKFINLDCIFIPQPDGCRHLEFPHTIQYLDPLDVDFAFNSGLVFCDLSESPVLSGKQRT